MSNVSYNFKDPIFEKNFLYRRLAKEHLLLQEIESDLIKIEVTDVRGPLKIPDTYYIHFYLKSITGINDDQSPKYGDHHIVELHLPLKYPMESPRIYMKTEIWHPNIKWEGKFKGRICGNTKEYGKGYDLTQ
ncbi:MAG: ubiquitin-conjugating enzyme E2, partial [Saprospiraceae bacterium]